MRFTSEQRLDDGVLEREFTLSEIPGILWTPGSASAPAPLILVGHPGGLHKMYPRLVARARHCAAEGFAAATIELPGSGDRPRSAAAEQARADLRRTLEAGEPVSDEIIDALILPLVTLGLRPLRLPAEMNRSGRICSTVSPAARRRTRYESNAFP